MANLIVNYIVDIPSTPGVFPSTINMGIVAMRHMTLDPAEFGADITAVELLSQPSIGRVVLQDNDTFVVNLAGSGQITGSTSFNVRVTQDGAPVDSTVTVTILAAEQLQGWGNQFHAILPVDETSGKWQLLKGENHKDWFIDSVAGMTIADIASDAGIGTGSVDGNFLIANHPTYGGSEGAAIAVDAAFELHRDTPDRSHNTYHLKRNGDYTGLQEEFGKRGLSGLYRSIITDYGVGARPIVRGSGRTFGAGGYSLHENLDFGNSTYSSVAGGTMAAINKCVLGSESNIQNTPYYVMMNCKVVDVRRSSPSGGDPDWTSAFGNRKSGIFLSDSVGSLLAYNFFDRNGWGPDYDVAGSYNPTNNGSDQPPSQYSHNIYLQGDGSDHGVWGNISSRAASQGIQFRAGGSSYENLMFANPLAGNILGQGNPGKEPGNANFTLSFGDIVTQGFGHNPDPVSAPGGQNWGINWASYQQSLVNSIVLHHNDPNNISDTTNPDGFAIRREYTSIASGGRGEFTDGSTWLVYNWGEPDSPTDGTIPDNAQAVNTAIANTYTLQRYTDQVLSRSLGTTTGVEDLIAHLRSLEDYRSVSSDVSDYFTNGMIAAGQPDLLARTSRSSSQTVKAVLDPKGRTSGKWWYASLDWDAARGDYPGYVDGDSADLQGHVFDATVPKEVTLTNLSLGNGGGLTVGGSLIRVNGTLSGTDASIGTSVSGVLAFNGYSSAGKLTSTAIGGLLANEGSVSGNVDITVGGQEFPSLIGHPFNPGYALLATGGNSITFGSGDTLEVQGYGIAALDGESGSATLNFSSGALLKFTALEGQNTTVNPARFGVIREYQTGLVAAAAPTITSIINLNNVPVEIDVTVVTPGTYVVADVDQINGSLGAVSVAGGSASIAVVGNTLEITVS